MLRALVTASYLRLLHLLTMFLSGASTPNLLEGSQKYLAMGIAFFLHSIAFLLVPNMERFLIDVLIIAYSVLYYLTVT